MKVEIETHTHTLYVYIYIIYLSGDVATQIAGVIELKGYGLEELQIVPVIGHDDSLGVPPLGLRALLEDGVVTWCEKDVNSSGSGPVG